MNYIEKLKLELGEEKVSDSLEHREAFARDESGIPELYLPDVVVHPESTEDVVKIAKIAYEHDVPMTPRGAGTSLSGGPLTVHGGILVVFDRMNHIKEIDSDNLMVITEPGVITQNLQNEVERFGMFYPPDPASLDQCTIGGNVATNAGGPRALKYGVTKHYLLELEVVADSNDGNPAVLQFPVHPCEAVQDIVALGDITLEQTVHLIENHNENVRLLVKLVLENTANLVSGKTSEWHLRTIGHPCTYLLA